MIPPLEQMPLAIGLALVFFCIMTATVAFPWVVMTAS